MNQVIRRVMLVVAGAQGLLAVAFVMQWTIAVRLWPFPGTTPLTYLFVASILAAACASTAWAAASKNDGALAGIALDYVAIFTPVSIFSYQLAARGGDTSMTIQAIVGGIGAVTGAALFAWSSRIPIDSRIPMPRLVRWSFVVFVALLWVVSFRLILNLPTIPWTLTPALSIVVGWMFFGASIYFAYALVRPSWINATGQLLGFLAYDLVLIGPFVSRLSTVSAEHRQGLILYTAVLVYSGMLAIWLLFIRRDTRMWRRAAQRSV